MISTSTQPCVRQHCTAYAYYLPKNAVMGRTSIKGRNFAKMTATYVVAIQYQPARQLSFSLSVPTMIPALWYVRVFVLCNVHFSYTRSGLLTKVTGSFERPHRNRCPRSEHKLCVADLLAEHPRRHYLPSTCMGQTRRRICLCYNRVCDAAVSDERAPLFTTKLTCLA